VKSTLASSRRSSELEDVSHQMPPDKPSLQLYTNTLITSKYRI
jgi:hypothetical protein